MKAIEQKYGMLPGFISNESARHKVFETPVKTVGGSHPVKREPDFRSDLMMQETAFTRE